MAKRIREAVDYGDRPERMDPRLERKLGDPQSLYAKNPALRKGAADVERLVGSRFGKVADKLRSAGLADLSPQAVQSFYMQMMGNLSRVVSVEQRHKKQLEDLAIKACLEETEIPEGWVKIIAQLGANIDVSNFRYQPEKEEKPKKKQQPQIPSFDVEDLTDEEILELEKNKRDIINAIIQGAAKKGHYIFQKPDVKAELDSIDPQLYPLYLAIMAVNDYMYFTQEQMIEMMSQTGQGVAGKVELYPEKDPEDGDDDSESEIDTVIKAQGMIFPILCHEIIKGIEESLARHGYPKDTELAQKVLSQTDVLSKEPMQMRIGPEIVEKFRNALPDEMFSQENKGLMNWFKIILYQVEAKEFLTKIIADAISDDPAANSRATKRFEEIMKEAQTMKQEFEDYQEEEDIDTSDDEDEGLDDFLSDLGIRRPD